MALLDKLLGRGKAKKAVEEGPPPECPHTNLVPRWDSVQDMGKAEKATSYVCEACGERFDAESVRRAHEAETGNARWQRPGARD